MKHALTHAFSIMVLALSLSTLISLSAGAQDTLSAPPPGNNERLGLPSAPVFQGEGAIAAQDAQNAPTATLPPQPASPEPAPGAGLTILTPKDGPRSVDEIPPEELPQELLDEMTSVEAECTRNSFYAAYHDCRCIAVKFFDERIKRGPYAVRNIIMNDVNNQCPNEAGIAGHIYRSCTEYMSWARPDYEDFCKCTANKVAERYARTPRMNTRYIQGLRKNAMLECGMPTYGSSNDADIQY